MKLAGYADGGGDFLMELSEGLVEQLGMLDDKRRLCDRVSTVGRHKERGRRMG